MLNSRNTHLIETSYDRLKSREITFKQRENLAKAGVFDGFDIHEHKRYYYTFDNSLLFTTKAFRTLHKSFHVNHNVGFFRVSTGALA